MGSTPGDTEQRIRWQRDVIARKVDQLEQRAESDIKRARRRAAFRATHVADLVPGVPAIARAARERPLQVLGGSVAAGFAVGWLTGHSNDGDARRPAAIESRSSDHGTGRGWLSLAPLGLAGALVILSLARRYRSE